jgi:flagellar basal body rod protein FlgC
MSTTGDIKLIPEKLRNKLIDLMNRQDRIISISQANNEMFLNEMIVASRLGYNHSSRLVEKDNFDDSYPLYNALHIDDNFRKIALIVKAAFKFKNMNERFQLARLKSTKENVNNIFTIINKELDSPYKHIESITNNTKSLAYLYQEGKTVDEIIAIVNQQDRENTVYNISEGEINNMGYHIMDAIKLNEEALKVFKFNTEFHPESWNTFDQLCRVLITHR